jgi:hypothetical protein
MGCRTPLEAFDHLDRAFARADWRAVIGLIDPADITAFRDHELAVLTDRTEAVLAARREGHRMQGFSSSAVLDLERLARVGSEPQEAFPGGTTLAELATLSPVDFLGACMEAGVAAAKRLKERAQEHGHLDNTTDSIRSRRRVIGVQAEGEDLAHVLYRWEGPQADSHPTCVDVRTARLRDGEWRVCIDSQLRMWVSPILAFHAFEDLTGSDES